MNLTPTLTLLLLFLSSALSQEYSYSASPVNKLVLPTIDNNKHFIALAYQSSSDSLLAKYVFDSDSKSIKIVNYKKYANSLNYVKSGLLFSDSI